MDDIPGSKAPDRLVGAFGFQFGCCPMPVGRCHLLLLCFFFFFQACFRVRYGGDDGGMGASVVKTSKIGDRP